jgi:hypothetical protein
MENKQPMKQVQYQEKLKLLKKAKLQELIKVLKNMQNIMSQLKLNVQYVEMRK